MKAVMPRAPRPVRAMTRYTPAAPQLVMNALLPVSL
jgi:hypothetical protein